MDLPPELTRIPPASLDVLRYMGRENIEAADVDTLADGIGMSSRAIGRAIRGLVTKGYLNMDDRYVYFLTEKGTGAIQDVMAYDAANPPTSGIRNNQPVEPADAALYHDSISEIVVTRELELFTTTFVAVVPHPLGARETTTLQFGLGDTPQVSQGSQIVLRVSALGGSVSPAEITLNLEPGQTTQPGETYFTPGGHARAVRFRVEVIQLLGDTDVHPAGGMFFDTPLAVTKGSLQAWYGNLNLKG